MGKTSREKPLRLAEKLLQVRIKLGLSQNEMLDRLDLKERKYRQNISSFERGEREPSLLILLRYARAANVVVDVLIDDRLDLPAILPASNRHHWALSRIQKAD